MVTMFDDLNPVPAAQRPDLLAPSTLAALRYVPEAKVIAIDPAISDTAAFSAHYDLPATVMGNAVLVMGKRQGELRQCCCMCLANRRVDVNGFVKHTLDVRSASFAPMDLAVESSGMEYGGITPVGLPPEWPVWLDETVRDVEWMVIGSGVRQSKLILPGKALLNLPGARLMSGLTNE